MVKAELPSPSAIDPHVLWQRGNPDSDSELPSVRSSISGLTFRLRPRAQRECGVATNLSSALRNLAATLCSDNNLRDRGMSDRHRLWAIDACFRQVQRYERSPDLRRAKADAHREPRGLRQVRCRKPLLIFASHCEGTRPVPPCNTRGWILARSSKNPENGAHER